ncbi:chromosome condensation protein CrcB [Mycobacteroides immunogenum]|uniref:Fluoride-specific ion channel FluC n=1 Tax=Mycobacteroides immunogenum TaxID=83262 RepID=A0A7V8RVP5_9MYCO|nr:fluoride efflux transporter CrcB [Mycobacteroides immunogenum]AMT71083.1 chromosome condensation protein CrcB [Mycobacteroides immunogenum]ANO04190.1 chromosome condensation protein CrcB [Mycobacteroides immunogenum]KIU39104.1 chromosome condensation protein CrcB [Mycobacteroides immunogenum]KPG04973.1 chromosome condensation protein CrcB [Mycobacteroides immunogenum]KPG06774.1 chromosome condensation protein CrcB [Mycobacteroides immunogenum]
MTVLVVVLAGALGAVLRFVVDSAVKQRWTHRFPWTTLFINLTGSAFIGLLAGLVMFHHSAPQLLTVLGTGFCGGYTTFSTASVESVRLVEQRQWSLALYNTFGTLLGTVGACAAGLALGWVLA